MSFEQYAEFGVNGEMIKFSFEMYCFKLHFDKRYDYWYHIINLNGYFIYILQLIQPFVWDRWFEEHKYMRKYEEILYYTRTFIL